MPSYRLLRNNKESGPYSLNDLVAFGLKPYDLVWVDGRSAAWRYPSEIGELKDFAPVVEEQPYDRFYKKPAATSESSESPNIPIPVKEEPVPAKNPVQKEEPAPVYQPQPSKQVFVSMPGKVNGNGHKPQQQEQQYQQYQQYQPKAAPQQVKPVEPVEEKSYSPINIQESEESKLETKYSQSLDDIKDMYINTLVQRKTRNRRKELVKKYAKPVLVSLFLLGAGAAIGYILTNKGVQVQAVQTAKTTAIPEQKATESLAGGQSNTATLQDLKPEKNQQTVLQPDDENILARKEAMNQAQKEYLNARIAPKHKVTNNDLKDEKKTEKTPAISLLPDNETAKVEKKNVEVDAVTGERRKSVRTQDNDDTYTEKSNNRNNTEQPKNNGSDRLRFIETTPTELNNLVSVKSNDYVRGAFGGIRDLKLTVYNHSDFVIDEVIVELQIMKPSEQPLRTDIITFKNIGPNAAVTVKVPDSQRGIRVDYKIKTIESKQYDKGTAGL